MFAPDPPSRFCPTPNWDVNSRIQWFRPTIEDKFRKLAHLPVKPVVQSITGSCVEIHISQKLLNARCLYVNGIEPLSQGYWSIHWFQNHLSFVKTLISFYANSYLFVTQNIWWSSHFLIASQFKSSSLQVKSPFSLVISQSSPDFAADSLVICPLRHDLVGGLRNMAFTNFHLLGISSSQLTFTPSFFRGVGRNHQPEMYDIIIPYLFHFITGDMPHPTSHFSWFEIF